MVAPSLSELLIVACGFGIVGLYMLIVHACVKSGEARSNRDHEAKSH